MIWRFLSFLCEGEKRKRKKVSAIDSQLVKLYGPDVSDCKVWQWCLFRDEWVNIHDEECKLLPNSDDRWFNRTNKYENS